MLSMLVVTAITVSRENPQVSLTGLKLQQNNKQASKMINLK